MWNIVKYSWVYRLYAKFFFGFSGFNFYCLVKDEYLLIVEFIEEILKLEC